MVTNNGSKDLTISGSLGAVSTALGTLSDTDGTPGSDTITVNASDRFGNAATQTTTAITVNGLPVLTAPTAKTIGIGKAALIPGGSLTESGNTAGETFTVTVADTHGLLSVTAGGGHRRRATAAKPDDLWVAGRGQHRLRHAERHRRHDGFRHHHGQRQRQLRQHGDADDDGDHGERVCR